MCDIVGGHRPALQCPSESLLDFEGCRMNSARIMVVDDDPQIRRVLRTALVAQDYEVIDARNGEEALEKLRDEKLDLVILDMNMPGMSGLEACRTIRATSDISIIMLTVRDT